MLRSESPYASVIIPTFNRLDALPEVLDATFRQEVDKPFEVVVVNDGSSDGTREYLAEVSSKVHLEILEQENSGPAVARNRGVRAARGEIVAFLGDDTVPKRSWLQAHLERHRVEESLALGVIGYTDWHPRVRQTAFLRYINDWGLQFGYSLIEDPGDLEFNFFYTSNLSLRRELLLEEPFNEAFPYAAWEDTEVSYRLKKDGVRLCYERRAEVLHDHPTDLKRFCSRQQKAGYCAVVFAQLHPELGMFVGVGEGGPPPLPSPTLQRLLELMAHSLQPTPLRWPALWERVLRFHYIRGLIEGWQELELNRN